MPETPPKWWSIEDFQNFLEFIELEPLQKLFRECFPFFFKTKFLIGEESIDGSVFFDIEQKDLLEKKVRMLMARKIEICTK